MDLPTDGRRRAFIEQLWQTGFVPPASRAHRDTVAARLDAFATRHRRVFGTLAPAECSACVFRIEARHTASERDFHYVV